MRGWQHKVVIDKVLTTQMIPGSCAETDREEILNSYGRGGWELVSAVDQA